MNTRLGALVLGFGFLWSDLAYWHRRELRWDPAKWSFVDDTGANTWRDRERRDPWELPAV